MEVLPTVAIQGKNTENIIPATDTSARISTVNVLYDHHIEAAIRSLGTIHHLERIDAIQALLGHAPDPDIKEAAAALSEEIERLHRMSVAQIIAGNRHHFAEHIGRDAIRTQSPRSGPDIDQLLTTRMPGIPILVTILIGVLLTVFIIGSWLEERIVTFINLFILEPFLSAGFPPLAEQLGVSLILAIQAGIGIAFPFIFTFYLLLSLLEDSGYLTRAAFLADRTLHRFGMHGQGIPSVLTGLSNPVSVLINSPN